MKPKVLVAGAIVALAILCVMAAVAYALASQGQAQQQDSAAPPAPPQEQVQQQDSAASPALPRAQQTCTVYGYVTDDNLKKVPGANVTLHVLRYDPLVNNASYDPDKRNRTEIYIASTVSKDAPDAGKFVFENVPLPEGLIQAYVTTTSTVNGTIYNEGSILYNLTPGENNLTYGVMVYTRHILPLMTVRGKAYDANGNPLTVVGGRIHVVGGWMFGGSNDDNTYPLEFRGKQPAAGTFNFTLFEVPEAYIDICAMDNGKMLYGRSNNFTFKSDDTVYLNVTCGPSPPWPTMAVAGKAYDANGNPLTIVNATVHQVGETWMTIDSPVPEKCLQESLWPVDIHEKQPMAGAFNGTIYPLFSKEFAYIDVRALSNGTVLYGRSSNFTLQNGGTFSFNVTCGPSPAYTYDGMVGDGRTAFGPDPL